MQRPGAGVPDPWGPPGRTGLKVCCIASAAEAALAVARGADAIGLVSSMPSGPGVIPEGLIAEIAATVPPRVATVLLTSGRDVAAIVDQQRRCGVSAIQLCDRLPPDDIAELSRALPGISVIQVVHVVGECAVEEARAAATAAHALLLDSGNPTARVRELGGTGRVHDWRISRRIRKTVGVPVFLAGGLTPDNVSEAVAAVQPFGVDVCSGVRSDGRLDEGKLARFVARLSTNNNGGSACA